MNRYKYRHKPVHKFDSPVRKNSADFNDSDIDIEPEFSLNNSINYDNGILINLDNNDETFKNDIFLNKNSSHSLDKHYNEEMNYDIKEKISKEKEDEKEKSEEKEKANNELYSDVEESEEKEESSEQSNSIKHNKKIEKIEEKKEEQEEEEEEEEEEKEEMKKKVQIEQDLINSIQNKEIVTRERINLAESIQFRNEPDKLIFTDDYGFIENNNSKAKKKKELEENNALNRKKKSLKTLLRINARLEKWNYMIQNYEEFSTKRKVLLKSRTRKGIPDSLRGYVWQLFADKDKYYVKDLYQNLENEPIKEDLETVIIKDLDRTFPLCQFFREKYGNGQRKLYKVLLAYSKYNKNVGYVQGMGFLAAVFLIYMDEESSFYMLHSLMKKYKLEGLYYDNFPDLKKKCFVLLNMQKKYINKLYNIFQRDGIVPTMYASSWFISLFARTVDFNIAVRILDCFFLEGFKVIYRISLALLKLSENAFCSAKKGETLPLLYKVQENINVEELFKVAFGFNISRNYIKECEIEYEKVKNDKNNEYMAQLAW